MSHGNNLTVLFDQDGNAVDVSLTPLGYRVLSVGDDRSRVLLENILEKLSEKEEKGPWDLTPWP